MERERIRKIRGRLGLSQERFAQLLGVSMQTVRRWESGLTRPLPFISLRLAQLEREARMQPGKGGPGMGERAGREDESMRMDIGLGLSGLFKGMGSLLDAVARMVEEGKEQAGREGTVEMAGGKLRGVYGFSVRLGLEGKPVIERFGNIRETAAGTVVDETREPLVDVLDEETGMSVIAEMPGVEEKDIHVKVEGDVLEIQASTGERRYQKEVLLPSPADPAQVATSYRNGILEIQLKKGGPERP